jgi:chromosome segregation ATPase
MTVEEIERTLQHVAAAMGQLTQAAVHADERQDAADSARREADGRIAALINAQVRFEARQEKLEEAFRQVAASHVQLVELLQRHEDRLDGHDDANERTDARLDALIDAQISARMQAEARGRLLDEKLAQLAEAQARTDEQIRLLIERSGGEAK